MTAAIQDCRNKFLVKQPSWTIFVNTGNLIYNLNFPLEVYIMLKCFIYYCREMGSVAHHWVFRKKIKGKCRNCSKSVQSHGGIIILSYL